MKLARYLERRLLHAILLLAAISVVAFATSHLSPGSFLDELRVNPQVSPQTIDALRQQYGLDQPVAIQYLRWMKSLLRGDLGYSVSYNLALSKLLWPRMWNTLVLGFASMLGAWMLALPAGSWSARRAGGWIDRVFCWSSTLLLGTPELVLALVFVLLAAHFRTLSAGQANLAQQGFQEPDHNVRRLIVPLAALALAAFPILFRHARTAMREAWNAPFICAAKGHGVSDTRLLLRHVLPVAGNPLISLLGLSLATVVSGSFLVEIITGWPGLGPLFLEAIYNRDSQVVMAIVMLFSVFLIVSNLIADLLLYASDPRMRAE